MSLLRLLIATSAASAVSFGGVASAADAPSDVPPVVARMMAAQGKAHSYHMHVVSPAADVDVDVVRPNDLHVVTGAAEIIRVGDTVYGRGDFSPAFIRLPVDAVTRGPLANIARLAADPSRATPPRNVTYADDGTANLDGTPMRKVRVFHTDTQAISELWIGADDLLYGIDVTGPNGKTTTIRYSKYNAVPAIVAPKEAQN